MAIVGVDDSSLSANSRPKSVEIHLAQYVHQEKSVKLTEWVRCVVNIVPASIIR